MKILRFFTMVSVAFVASFLGACGDDSSSANSMGNEPTDSKSSASEIESSSVDYGNSSGTIADMSSAETPASSAGLSSSETESSGAGSSAAASSVSSATSSSLSSATSSNASSASSSATVTSSTTAKSSASAITGDTTKIIYALKPFEGPLANPHKGFTVVTDAAWIFDPAVEYGPYGAWNNRAWDLITYGSGYRKWSDLHKGEGVYDWTDLDKLLTSLAEHGMGYALRVFPYSTSFIKSNDTPAENYDWTPKFVYEKGAKNIKATVKGNSLLKSGTQAQVPVWSDSIYLKYVKEFATALAAKYDGDPRIEYIDIRTFGEWGEWHVSNLVESQMPSLEIQKDIVKHYASVFKKTQLALPSDGYGEIYTYALSLGVTKRDDGMIGIPGTADSLVRAYKANLPTIAENMGQYSIMLTYTDVIPGDYLKWTPERWVDAIKTAHLTYYVLDQDEECAYQFYKDNKALADSMTHVIGYNFKILEASLSTVTGTKETQNTLNITVKNTGVAPCFFDVYMVAEFVDSAGKVLAQFGETVKIPKATFHDGDTKKFSFVNTVAGRETNIAALPGVSVALSLYESEESFKAGKNPTVRFDNDGYLENKKLLLKP